MIPEHVLPVTVERHGCIDQLLVNRTATKMIALLSVGFVLAMVRAWLLADLSAPELLTRLQGLNPDLPLSTAIMVHYGYKVTAFMLTIVCMTWLLTYPMKFTYATTSKLVLEDRLYIAAFGMLVHQVIMVIGGMNAWYSHDASFTISFAFVGRYMHFDEIGQALIQYVFSVDVWSYIFAVGYALSVIQGGRVRSHLWRGMATYGCTFIVMNVCIIVLTYIVVVVLPKLMG